MNYSILINTCDKFDDCWKPFFQLWSTYWDNCNGKIYLNTEYKDFSFNGLEITPLKVCEKNNIPRNKRATWSQCLKWALEAIQDDIVLYLQEDYFLKASVKNEIVENFVQLMHMNPQIKCIHLTDQAVSSSDNDDYPQLNKVILNQRYRVSCQAALWRKQELLDLIREEDDAWEFEEFGSERSAVLKSDYYAVDKNWVRINEFEIIPYVFTGIIQGRWFEEVIPLFEKHNITVDYEKRGFVKDTPQKPLLKRISYRLKKINKILKHNKEIKRLKTIHG